MEFSAIIVWQNTTAVDARINSFNVYRFMPDSIWVQYFLKRKTRKSILEINGLISLTLYIEPYQAQNKFSMWCFTHTIYKYILWSNLWNIFFVRKQLTCLTHNKKMVIDADFSTSRF